MADTRADAYLKLIGNLLNAPNGEESAILNANSDLVDGGLIEMMVEVAESLAERGENNAGWLQNFAAQLAEARGISSTATTSEEYFNLLMKLLRATSASDGNPEVVYPLLEANQDKLDLIFAEVLSNWARETLPQQEATAAAEIAGVIGNFGNLIRKFPLAKRRDNLEIAIVG
ncbi:MAG TPA: hypothetical protein DEG17_13800 [Cyanobacteria bacterium UBA11149]|nr:hypothetical protein [Cyanobacteria bacterium UBA11367]HBE58863.1 hypothetical protein [Cyanobacteria bacterium UBA11366]HBR74710.1 hypothetical protein [Cyanobacteria bacterium UBA11159]HBS70187.1 hypothetical protein [Cyanobacteria bacterium UBA11153]HBW89914.1 hypothetical protein [Cyanobacteria bacterium UBA11149]HCA95598.1 hypothetical protein [Cyanobacteria bacterium UBA9226]